MGLNDGTEGWSKKDARLLCLIFTPIPTATLKG